MAPYTRSEQRHAPIQRWADDLTLPIEKENADGEKGTQRDSDSTNAHSQRRSPGDLARRGQPENAHADHGGAPPGQPQGRGGTIRTLE